MSYSFQATSDDRAELILDAEPPYCRVLPMAPPEREPDLNDGIWLVLAYAAWSGPDRRAIPLALTVVKRFGGQVHLGIRKFSEHDEIRVWCPEAKEKWASPVWLVSQDGKLVDEFVGVLDEEDLVAKVQQALERED
ncbi:MAG TPA: hypothetical protein VKI65_07640 [Gemmataceae bacterium]|nr:hypothetical protein [Gemmataceae bacterium]